MTGHVYWVLEVTINPGRFEELKTLVAVCHIYERYEDAAAAMTHMESFGAHFVARFMEVVRPTRLVVYGAPSAQLKDALAGLNPVYMAPFSGFRR
jgi:hypothetical protein